MHVGQDSPQSTKTVDVLYGGDFSQADSDILVREISLSIQQRLKRRPDAIVYVRWAGSRINYDPSAKDVASIGSSLRKSLIAADGASHVDISDRQHRFENLLKPLVYFNRDKPSFADLPLHEGQYDYDKCYGSCLAWCPATLKKLGLLNSKKKDQAVQSLLGELCKRVYGEVKWSQTIKMETMLTSDDRGSKNSSSPLQWQILGAFSAMTGGFRRSCLAASSAKALSLLSTRTSLSNRCFACFAIGLT